MGQKTSWIAKILWLLLAGVLLAGCAKPGLNRFSHIKRPPPSVGLGDPKKAKQYQKVTKNLWTELADHFNLPDETPAIPEVKAQINWFMSHQAYLKRVTARAEPYLYYIYQQVNARGLPAELTLMPMIESAYNPLALNGGSGAIGLWQMMPGTASGFGLQVNWWYDGRRDVAASTNAALDYMAYLGNFFNGNWLLAIAAYDTGEGNVQQAIKRNVRLGKPTDFWSLKLVRETQTYVPKILALATILKHPKTYPIDWPQIKNAPYLAEVDVNSQIDLYHAAKMAGMSREELSNLNPGYSRWATDPNTTTKLLLPVEKTDRFKIALEKWENRKKITWYHIETGSSDTLEKIAVKYHTTIATIKKANHLTSNHLKWHQILLIPDQQTTATNTHFGEKIINLPETNIIHHTVTSGQTVQSIAQLYHVKIREVTFWNKLKADESLATGQDIAIWPPKYHPPAKSRYSSVNYKVRPHDTISHIARHYHLGTAALIKANHIKHNMIHPGEILHIPTLQHTSQIHHATANRIAHYHANHATSAHTATSTHHIAAVKNHRPAVPAGKHHLPTYTVKPGDTLMSISRRYHVSLRTLKAENPSIKNGVLHPGEHVAY